MAKVTGAESLSAELLEKLACDQKLQLPARNGSRQIEREVVPAFSTVYFVVASVRSSVRRLSTDERQEELLRLVGLYWGSVE